MTRVKIFDQDFVASDATVVDTEWAMPACPDSTGLQVHTNAVEGSSAFVDQGNVVVPASEDKNGDTTRATFAPDQYSVVEIRDNTLLASPGALARGDDGSDDAYMFDSVDHGGFLELVRFDSGVYNQIASTFSGPSSSVGDTVEIETEGSTIRGGINGVADLSTTDGTHATGAPGVYCFEQPSGPVGDNLECGNLFCRVQRHRSAGVPPRIHYERRRRLYHARLTAQGSG